MLVHGLEELGGLVDEPMLRRLGLRELRPTHGDIVDQRLGPLLVVDLAMPRDFEERCGTIDEIFVKNLDDLQGIMTQNIARRQSELPRAERIVEPGGI